MLWPCYMRKFCSFIGLHNNNSLGLVSNVYRRCNIEYCSFIAIVIIGQIVSSKFLIKSPQERSRGILLIKTILIRRYPESHAGRRTVIGLRLWHGLIYGGSTPKRMRPCYKNLKCNKGTPKSMENF